MVSHGVVVCTDPSNGQLERNQILPRTDDAATIASLRQEPAFLEVIFDLSFAPLP
jgi:hypothetical protein